MKKALKIIGVIFLSMLVIMIAVVFIVKSMDLPEEAPVIQINEVDLNLIEDGTYTGEYTGGLVKAAVEVRVKDHKITEINITKHDNGLGKKAEKIVDDVISKQSLDVEVVSGATTSSKTILKAIEVALKNNK